MKLSKPVLIEAANSIFYQVDVGSSNGSHTLWYSLDKCHAPLICDSSDAALIALLIPAMAAGEDIYIDGTISEKLFYSVSGPLQVLLKTIIPSLHLINIRASSLNHEPNTAASGIITGFSGGIDSFCILADHHYADIPERLKVSHLLFNNVGSHGKGGERLFQQRYQLLVPFVEHIGLPFLAINSNLDQFYQKPLTFQLTHSLRNTSATLLLQQGIKRYLYASSYYYPEVFIGKSKDIGYSDLITLPMLSTETLEACSVSSHLTRLQKNLRVTDIEDSYTAINVCVNDKYRPDQKNCSKCTKCLRTMATLEIAGWLDRYASCFDLSVYSRHRTKYFTQLLESSEPKLKEIVEFARKRHFSFPAASLLHYYSGIYPALARSKRIFREARKRRKGIAYETKPANLGRK